MFKNFFVSLILFVFVTPVFADNISYTGCFEKSRSVDNLTLRMQDLQASINITDAANQTYNITIENIDADWVQIDNYNPGSIIRNTNSLSFSLTVLNNAIINITPWYTSDDVYFVALSDPQIGSSESYEANETYNAILEQMKIINPYFITSSGDNITGSSISTTHQNLFISLQAKMASIDSPHFTVPGNHDRYNSNLDIYKAYFGDTEYSFNYLDNHFSFISSVDASYSDGYWSEDALLWLNTDLNNTNKNNKFIFFHHPLYPASWNFSSTYVSETNRNNAAAIISNYYSDYVINGHQHGYDYNYLDNTKISSISNGFNELITGGAGGQIYQPDGYHHYNLFHVDSNNNISFQTINSEEDYLHRTELSLNDGTENISSINITNDSSTDLNWLRLKFKISKNTDHVFAYDDLGNYYEYQDKELENYHVYYLEANLAALDSRTFFVGQSKYIHQGLNNFVYADGDVNYPQTPSTANLKTAMQVLPNADYSTIVVSSWTSSENKYNRQWQEVAAQADVSTLYTFTDLPSGYRYLVKVNDDIYGYYYPDANTGILEFTYTGGDQIRNFSITQDDLWLANDISVLPASGGGSQIRIFNADGEVVNQFYAYNTSWQGGYNIITDDINADLEPEIITIPETGNKSLLRVFNLNGDQLAQTRVFKSSYLQGANIVTGDINNDGYKEIIASSMSGKYGYKIIIYQYDQTTGKLNKIKTKKVYDKNFTGGVTVLATDFNYDGADEIITAPFSGQNSLKIYQYENNKLNLLSTLNNAFSGHSYDGINIAAGNINKTGKKEIIIIPKNGGNNELKIYQIKNNNFYLLKKKKLLSDDYRGGFNVKSADLNSDFDDEIIVLPQADYDKIKLYHYKNSKIKLFDTIKPYGSNYTDGFHANFIDLDNNWDAELVVAPKYGNPNIRIYDNIGSDMSLYNWFWGYSTNFIGGINL